MAKQPAQQATQALNDAAQQFQSMFGDGWQKALQAFKSMDFSNAGAGLGDMGLSHLPPPVSFAPDKLQELQGNYMKEVLELWNQGLHATTPTQKDRRFSGDAWAHNPVAAYAAAVYLLNARTLMGLSDAVVADEKTRLKAQLQNNLRGRKRLRQPRLYGAFERPYQRQPVARDGGLRIKIDQPLGF